MDRTAYVIAALVVLLALTVTALTVGPRVVPGDAFFGDKMQHALGFGAIVAPAALLRPRWLWWMAPAVIAFGGLIEVVQAYVGRDAELGDWAADAAGVLISSALAIALRRAVRRRTPIRSN